MWHTRVGFGVVRELRGHRHPVVDVGFFPAGDRLLTAAAGGDLLVWDVRSGAILRRLEGGHAFQAHAEGSSIFQAHVFPDGEHVATLGCDRLAIVWSVLNGKPLRRIDLAAYPGTPRVLRVLAPGDRFVTGGTDDAGDPVVIWSVVEGRALHVLDHLDPVEFLEAAPCGAAIVTVGWHAITMWDAGSGKLRRTFATPDGYFHSVAVSAGGRHVVTSIEERLFVWDGLSGQVASVLTMDGGVYAFELLQGGRLVAFTQTQGVVWDLRSSKRLGALPGSDLGPPQRVVVSGDVVAACGSAVTRGGAAAWLWGRAGGRDIGARFAVELSVWTKVWDTATGRVLRSAMSHSAQVVEGGSPEWACALAVGPVRSLTHCLDE